MSSPSPVRRLIQLCAVVLGMLGALELLCRVNDRSLAAVAHRVHFKLALLEAKGLVDFVALGSSRSNDGIGPAEVGLGVGFSAATPSTSLPTLEYFATHLGRQKRVLVELSVPTFTPTPMELVAGASTPLEGDPLGAWLNEHSALLRLRRAFALENLPRVFALGFASHFDGSEWLRTRQLIETFRDPTPPEGVHDDDAWRPALAVPTEAATLTDDGQRVVAGYERLIAALRANGAQVVLMSPPVGAGWRGQECVPELNALRGEIARRTGAPYVDFTCAEVNEAWFLEGQHLSNSGRARYSRALGEAIRGLP